MAEDGDGRKVGDAIVERLRAWGVRRIFGYSGDGIDGLLAALDRAGNEPEWIPATHEEISGLMACAHAKLTGEVGVCMATSGPGAIHLLNGLYDAALDHQPVVAIVGQQNLMAMGSHYQQEVDLPVLLKDVAGAFVRVVADPNQVDHVVDRAFRIALDERAVTCLIVPHDVQNLPAVETPPHEHGAMHSSVGYSRPRVVPLDADLDRAAAVLNAGERVAILAGAGALGAAGPLRDVAERLGAGIAKSLLGKTVVPDDLAFVTGSAGWLGTAASNWMLANCDTLLLVGTTFPYTEYLPKAGTARGVQIDIEGRMLGVRYPTEVNLVGDSAETLGALLERLEIKRDRAWRAEIERRKADWDRELERRAMLDADPLNPERVFFELDKRLTADTILTGDSGSSTVWYARYLRVREGMLAAASGTLATMGSALPYALAAKLAHPDRPVVATLGDGTMQMSGVNALIDVAASYRRWSDPRLVVVVLRNRDLNYVSWEQRLIDAAPKFPASQGVPDMGYARYAELLGLRGIRVDAPEQVGPALDEAFAADRPVLIDAVVDPAVPPVPPKLTPELRTKLEQALAQGDPEARQVMERLEAEGALSG